MYRPALSAIVALAAVAVVSIAQAETKPEDAIKYRQFAMSAMAAHIGALSYVQFGRVEHRDHLKTHAQALADLGAQLKVLFPANSAAGETDALARIWAEPEAFARVVQAMEKATADLNAAVLAGDAAGIAQGFRAVGASCKDCHDRYRAPQD